MVRGWKAIESTMKSEQNLNETVIDVIRLRGDAPVGHVAFRASLD